MTRLSQVQERARRLLEDGMAILKVGVKDAGMLAESTAGAARLHVEVGRKRFELYRALHDIGEELMSALGVSPAGESIALTPAMAALIEQALELDRSIKHDEEELDRFSVVKGERGGPPSPMKKRQRPKAGAKAPVGEKRGGRPRAKPRRR
ncbi:MAG TPA: hypothetical protein PLY45_00635 [bacterium]|nr:hypothetical protein [bacterium]